MAGFVQLPDGSYYPVQDGMSYTDAMRAAYAKYPEAFGGTKQEPTKKTGLGAALSQGAESLLSSGRTALEAAFGSPEEAARAGLERGKAMGEKYADQVSLERVKEKYQKEGLLPAAGEAISQIPAAIAEQAPNIAATLGGARLGALAGSALGPYGAIVGGLAGAVAPSLVQQFGSNVERQAREQLARGEPLEISRASAAAAAAPQAALDVAGTFIPLGGRLVSKFTGIPAQALVGRTAEQASKLADERLLATLAKGTAVGAVAEIPTEIAQQMLERAQAGLSLTSPDALAEYGETAYQVGLLAPIGAAGRISERGGARQEVAKRKEEEARVAAEQAEAAKNAPDALIQLDEQYRAALQQRQILADAVATKPVKGSTPEERKAYAEGKKALTEFDRETFTPLEAEYNKRKDAIEALYAGRQADAEAQATQPAVVRATTDLPGALPYETIPVTRLMEQYDNAKRDFDALGQQLAAATPQEYPSLYEKYKQEQARIEELASTIEAKGGTTETPEQLAKNLKRETDKFNKLKEEGDFESAQKQLATLQDLTARQTVLGEKQANLEQRGQTRPLFEDITPAPDERAAQDIRAEEAERGLYGPESKKESAKQAFAETEVGPRGQIEPREVLDEEAISKDRSTLDIFSDYNIINTAIRNRDERVLRSLAADEERRRIKSLDEAAQERRRLAEILDRRLDLAGTKRERVSIIGKLIPDPKLRQRFVNGTYPDSELQQIYDKSGMGAVEYEIVMRDINELKKKVETKQGNAKQSVLAQVLELDADIARMTAQMESGIAEPTMREKVAGVQAKLGKGETPTERQMDASERYQLKRRLDAAQKKYAMLINTKVVPVRDQILKLYDSLYETKQVRKASEIRAEREAEAEAEARKPKAKSRAAATAARIQRGDVRKEAEASEKMRDLAKELGREDPAYKEFLKARKKRLDALIERYGKDDDAVRDFKAAVREEMEAKAIELGKKTPEYKATLKEQIEYFKEVLPTAGKQEVPSKRTTQVTRRQSSAPKRMVTSSAESRAETAKESLRIPGKMSSKEIESIIKEVNDSEGGTAYRLRESDAAQRVDATQAKALADKVKAGLPENVKFVYAAEPGQIPVRLLKQMQKDGVDPTDGMVQGAVFPDGTVLVVGSEHADIKDLEATIAHELVGHYGIDTLIGLDRLNAYAAKTDLYKLAKDLGGDRLVREAVAAGEAMQALGKDEKVQRLQALREIIAHVEEARVTESFRQKAGRFLKELIGMVRAGLRNLGFTKLPELSTSDVFYMLRQSRKAFNNKTIGPYRKADGETAFRRAREASDSVVAREPGIVDKVLGNLMGLAGRVQLVDQYAALSAVAKKGMSAGQISSLEATNMEYLLRFGQQRSQYAGQFLTNGPVKLELTKKAGGTESIYRSVKGTSMMDVAKALSAAKLGSDIEQENKFTVYLAGERARQVGWEKLNFSNPAKAKAEYDAVMAELNANKTAKDAFENAKKLYQEYNAGLLDFLVNTGALSERKAAELKAVTYVPFYRINNNGEVQLMIDKEHPIRIANIKDEPQLKELVGGNTAIMPVFTSAVQNTFMITNLGLRNQAVKEAAFMLRKLGMASRVAPGKGPTGSDVVRFKKNGEDHYAIIDTDVYGIPAELVVRGMEGIKTTMPAAVRLLGYPADILRKFVTRNPTYAIRQAVRDPLNAWLTTGTNATPVLSSFKELGSMVAGRSEVEQKLMETGAISSNVFTGDVQDMQKFLNDLAAGKPGWAKGLAYLDALAVKGDAATRAVIYKDSLAQGLSEQEALLRTLESMNFSRRGVSPSMQVLSTLIPFFNAQIQGLDVLYRAYKGDMPFSEQLKIKEKMLARGMLMAAGTMAYAALMSDDEAYKRAKPEERYGNWFVYVPGVSEPVRVPIPFELGYLFKALPEAVYNMAANDEKASKALGGWLKLVAQTNPFSLPQAVKPITEVALGKSFFSGDIESAREKQLLPQERYRENTTELAKLIGSVTASETVKKITGKEGITPIEIDYLLRGYFGGLGIAVVQLANPILNTEVKAEIAKPTLKASKTPFIGGLFQPVEGRGTLDEAYDVMQNISKTKATLNTMVERGDIAKAREFAQQYATQLSLASTSGAIQKALGELAKQERIVRQSPSMTTEQKDAMLERIDKVKTQIARQFLAAAERTTPQ